MLEVNEGNSPASYLPHTRDMGVCINVRRNEAARRPSTSQGVEVGPHASAEEVGDEDECWVGGRFMSSRLLLWIISDKCFKLKIESQ